MLRVSEATIVDVVCGSGNAARVVPLPVVISGN